TSRLLCLNGVASFTSRRRERFLARVCCRCTHRRTVTGRVTNVFMGGIRCFLTRHMHHTVFHRHTVIGSFATHFIFVFNALHGRIFKLLGFFIADVGFSSHVVHVGIGHLVHRGKTSRSELLVSRVIHPAHFAHATFFIQLQ